jgi:hypothetical protein
VSAADQHGRTRKETLGRLTASLRTRAALGLRPVTAPVIVFVPIGVLLGPMMLGIVSDAVLGHLDVVISIVLATLGVFIGIATGRGGPAFRRLLAASTVEASITIVTVGGALFVLAGIWKLPLILPAGLVALTLGICASASAAPSVRADDPDIRRIAARVADLDDVLPIVLGGVVVVLAAPREGLAVWHAAGGVAIGLAIAAAGLLLIRGTEDPAERAVFVLGMLALLGGCAAYLVLSPLLTGMAAGLLWAAAPGQTDRVVARELEKVQHPLVVLLLVIAGASIPSISLAGLWLFAPYVVFRLAGKLIGSWAASKVAPAVTGADLGVHLIAPGVIGIAFALNLHQAVGHPADVLVFAVSAGAIASEVVAVAVTPSAPPAGAA